VEDRASVLGPSRVGVRRHIWKVSRGHVVAKRESERNGKAIELRLRIGLILC
jgi:hypothetical protein